MSREWFYNLNTLIQRLSQTLTNSGQRALACLINYTQTTALKSYSSFDLRYILQNIFTFTLLPVTSFGGRTEGPQTQGAGQHLQLHDHVTHGVAEGSLKLVSQLQGADVALLPHVKAHVHLGH